MLPILRPEKIRALDRATIEQEPIASIDLMERAATAFAQALRAELTEGQACYILAGSGNNGGDALVVARLLHQMQHPVRVVVLMLGATGSPDFQTNLERVRDLKLPLLMLQQRDEATPEALPPEALPDWSEVVVDGLFGSGLNRAPEGTALALIQAIGAVPEQRVYAIDMPSGLREEGPAPGCSALPATRTWTFEVPKAAFLLPDRGAVAGEWSLLPIGLHPDSMAGLKADAHYLQAVDLLAFSGVDIDVPEALRPRARFAHKRLAGEVLVLGGARGMRGAAWLSGRAALRAGAGLVSILHPDPEQAPAMAAGTPELMLRPELPEALSKGTALVLGPGLGKSPAAMDALRTLLECCRAEPRCHLVLDADALNAFAEGRVEGPGIGAREALRQWADGFEAPPVLSPHPGEYQRLFGPLPEGRARWDHVREAARNSGCVVVLKGAYTLTASPSGALVVNGTGNPGMASAGSGDVLAGIIAALLAQGLPPQEAACIAVAWHGLAGDEAVRRLGGESGLLASDLIEALPEMRRRYLESERRPLDAATEAAWRALRNNAARN